MGLFLFSSHKKICDVHRATLGCTAMSMCRCTKASHKLDLTTSSDTNNVSCYYACKLSRESRCSMPIQSTPSQARYKISQYDFWKFPLRWIYAPPMHQWRPYCIGDALCCHLHIIVRGLRWMGHSKNLCGVMAPNIQHVRPIVHTTMKKF